MLIAIMLEWLIAIVGIRIGGLNSRSVASILSHNLDLAVSAEGDGVDSHANVRGPLYFQ